MGNDRPTLSPLLQRATGVRVERGEGVYLFSDDGRRYLDFTAGIGVTSTGHCHPKVVAAIREQAGRLIHGQYTTVEHGLLEVLGSRLAEVMPGAIDSFFYASAGTEAVEAAVRLVRHATGRTNIVVFQGSFHGRTSGSLAMTTSKAAYRAGLQPLMAGVFVAPFPYAYRYGWSDDETTAFCLDELDFMLASQTAPAETAAVFVEPVLGEGGYVPATPGFLEGVQERCAEHGMLFVADEIQTGVGRTGRFWGIEHHAVEPDVVITAKGLGSGMPISAIGAPHELMARGWAGSQGGTYGGNPVSCAAAIASLDVVADEDLVGRATTCGARLVAGLEELQAKHDVIGDVRGRGLMIGIELTGADREPLGSTATALRGACEERGLLLLPCGTHGNVVRFVPPLVVTEDQIDEALAIFGDALASVA